MTAVKALEAFILCFSEKAFFAAFGDGGKPMRYVARYSYPPFEVLAIEDFGAGRQWAGERGSGTSERAVWSSPGLGNGSALRCGAIVAVDIAVGLLTLHYR